MKEDEKGAPIQGEEPAERIEETGQGLPGEAAPAAGLAAPERDGEEPAPAAEPVGEEPGAPEAGSSPEEEPAQAEPEATPVEPAAAPVEGPVPPAVEEPSHPEQTAEPGPAPQQGEAAPGQPYGPQPQGYGPGQPWPGYQGYGYGSQPPVAPGAPYPGYPGYNAPPNGYPYPGQGGYQPGYGPQPGQAGYPAYGPQPGYPGQPVVFQPAYGGPVPQPKKKLPLGLKVFLWVASVLAAGAILGFAIYLGYSASTGTGMFQSPSYEEYFPELPYEDEEPGTPEAPEEESEEELPPLPEVDVTPNSEGIQIQEKPGGEALDAQGVYNKVAPSTVTVTVRRDPDSEKPDSTGTGIIATADGYIITNAHVVLHSKSVYVKVTTYDGQEYDAVVVGSDRTTDLAVIKTNDHGFTPAEFGDAGALSIGEWVLAIGNPGGERFSSSLTRGIISGLDREVGEYSENGMTYIQTDAAINPGNSGGPLVNMYGQVVGINSSKIMTEGYEGMGFAIPVSTAKDIIDQLLTGGYVEGRVRLGIMGREIDGTMAMIYGLPQGFMISELPEDSAFAGTGAQVGDVITAIDGNEVTSLSEISNLLLRYSPGDQVTVTLFRQNDSGVGGEEIDVTITLLEDRGETQE